MPTRRGSGVVDDPDPQPFGLDHQPLRQARAQRRVVHVSLHRRYGRPLLELAEDGSGGEVARVHNEVGGAKKSDTFLREAPRAPGQMRISDYRNQNKSSRKVPSR